MSDTSEQSYEAMAR